jgi:hypothetical protein
VLFRKFINLAHCISVGGAANSDSDEEEKTVHSAPPDTVESDADGSDYPCEEYDTRKSAHWNMGHAAYLVGVPALSFRQKTVYAYPSMLDINKISFDADGKGTGSNPKFSIFFQPNVGARFSIHLLLEFADFEIVSFPGRVTARDRTPEPTIGIILKYLKRR